MHIGTSKVQKAAVGYGDIKCKQLTLKMRKLEVWTIGYFSTFNLKYLLTVNKNSGTVNEHNDQNCFSKTASSVLALCFHHLWPHRQFGYKTFLVV